MSSPKRKRKVAVISAITIAILAIVVFVAMKANAKDKKEPDLPVKVGKAEVADVQVKVTEVGTVEPEVKVDVKSALSGKVVDILHREGDVVRRGDVLARVEPDLNQAQALAETKNELAAAEIRYSEARKNYDADNSLFSQGLLAPKAHRDTETTYLSAKQDFEKAREKYNLVEKSGIPIHRSAEAFGGSNVVAPMNGVVLTKAIEIGETVTSGVSSFNAGTVMFTVADISSMIVKAGVNEVDIGKIKVGMPVKVSLDAFPKTKFNGRIDRIAPAVRVDDKVRVFDVEVRLDAQGRELRSGMTANIEVAGDRKDKVLTVPVESVFQRDEGEIVYVKKNLDAKTIEAMKKNPPKKDDKEAWKRYFEKRVVVTGLADNSHVEIISGVKAGEQLALEDPTLPADKKKDENDD